MTAGARRFVLILLNLLAAGFVALTIGGARAEGGAPGDFDFYVLSLSWSPNYCANDDDPDRKQCDLAPPGFVLHGLWPQYEEGYPEYCASSASRRLKQSTLNAISDLMPSGGLARYQWGKHGLCSGLAEEDYFALMRQAFEQVAIPAELKVVTEHRSVAPAAVEAAFIKANPGLAAGGIAATCNRAGLKEVRICLGKDLAFRTCREVDADGCRAPRLLLRAAP
jgi:ribonuclease T2